MLFFGNASEALTPGPVQMLVALALLWFACGLVMRRGYLYRRGPAVRSLIALLFVWIWVLSTPALASLALNQLEGDAYLPATPSSPEPLYLVPGAGTPAAAHLDSNAQLTLAGWRRTAAAVDHWRHSGGRLLFAGGLGSNENPAATSVGAAMARVAMQMGVPASDILVTGFESRNTWQDMQAAQPLVARHGTPAYLITSAAHMPRTLAVARSLGMTVTPLPTDWRQLRSPGWRAWLPNNGGPALWQQSIYELLGTIVYQWRGWIAS